MYLCIVGLLLLLLSGDVLGKLLKSFLVYLPKDLRNQDEVQHFFAHYLLIVAFAINLFHSLVYLFAENFTPMVPLLVKGATSLLLLYILKISKHPRTIIRITLMINIWGVVHNALLYKSFESTPVVALLFLVMIPAVTLGLKEAIAWAVAILSTYLVFFSFSYYSLFDFVHYRPLETYFIYSFLLLTFSIFLFIGLRIIFEHLTKSFLEVNELRTDKSLLFRTLIHDISSPLQLIALSSRGNEKVEKALHQINSMVDTVRKLETNELHKGTILEKRFSWYEQLEKICDLYASTFEQKSIDLLKDIPDEIKGRQICGDENLFLSQILGNVFSNAIKFSPENGTIYISAKSLKDNRFTLSVRDTGVGIPKDKIHDLFSFSTNVSTVGTAGEIGSGLGIPIMKGICNLHDIDLYVDSKVKSLDSKEHGTTFILTMNSTH